MEHVPERMRKEYLLPNMDSTFRVFAAHWRTADHDWKYPLHKHPLFEVNVVLSGTQEMIVNRTSYVQNPGDIMLLIPGDEHESRAIGGENMTYYCLHFDVDERAFRELLCRNKIYFYSSNSELATAIRPALDKLITLTKDETSERVQSRMITLSALFELFAGISGTLSKQDNGDTVSRMSQAASQIASRLERAVDTAEADDGNMNGHEIETIESIATEIGYSMSSVNRMFTSVYGVSPRQYMSTLMLKKAKLLLMDTEHTIEMISAKLGYKNIAHFSRQFKRWTGESPSSFRSRFYK